MSESVSVITVSFNARDFIERCLESVMRQTVPVEHIVVDGGSTDGSAEIIEEYRERGSVAVFISEPDKGMYDAMNKGITRASGDIIGILNADDEYYGREVIRQVLDALENRGAESCYGDLVYVRPNNPSSVARRWVAGEYEASRFYNGWMPPHPTFFVRRRIYERYGLYRLDMGSSADYELMLRFLLKHNVTSCYIPRTLVIMRTGGVSNASLFRRILANRNDRLAWRVNGLRPYPWTVPMKPLRKVGQFVVLGRKRRLAEDAAG